MDRAAARGGVVQHKSRVRHSGGKAMHIAVKSCLSLAAVAAGAALVVWLCGGHGPPRRRLRPRPCPSWRRPQSSTTSQLS